MFRMTSTHPAALESAYLAWRFAADESGDALHAWWASPRDARDARYATYLDALDREERAALIVAERVRCLSPHAFCGIAPTSRAKR